MRSREIISELGNTPYRSLRSSHRGDRDEFVFQSDRTLYKVRVRYVGNHAIVGLVAQDLSTGIQRIDITGTGNTARVFATVGAILREALGQNDVDFLEFESDAGEPSRVGLYRRIARNIGRWLPDYVFDREVRQRSPRDLVIFVVRKKNIDPGDSSRPDTVQ